eukprot:2450511-Prymnesium_polylepis.1
MVELSNGCICCTLREDLLTSITSLVAENHFDHVLIESLGISEPLPVAETFHDKETGARLSDIASLRNMVTVVDAASIFQQLNTLDLLADRGWQASEADRALRPASLRSVRADAVSEAELGAVEALVKRINPKAEVLRTIRSKLEPGILLDTARFDMQRAKAHPQWLKEAREHDHTPETIEDWHLEFRTHDAGTGIEPKICMGCHIRRCVLPAESLARSPMAGLSSQGAVFSP